MRIVVGADHAGVDLKGHLIARLRQSGCEIIDVGTHGRESVDYPRFAVAVGRALQAGEADRGLLICGSGVGVSIAANKLRGIRAGLCHDCYSARQGVEHDDMNVLVLGAGIVGEKLAADLLTAFLSAQFSGEERHRRRLDAIADLER